jgi:hypothetical protein
MAWAYHGSQRHDSTKGISHHCSPIPNRLRALDILNEEFYSPDQKIASIRPLRHHIFGTDFQKRDDMTDDEALTRFDKVWSERIAPAIVIVGHYWHND